MTAIICLNLEDLVEICEKYEGMPNSACIRVGIGIPYKIITHRKCVSYHYEILQESDKTSQQTINDITVTYHDNGMIKSFAFKNYENLIGIANYFIKKSKEVNSEEYQWNCVITHYIINKYLLKLFVARQ